LRRLRGGGCQLSPIFFPSTGTDWSRDASGSEKVELLLTRKLPAYPVYLFMTGTSALLFAVMVTILLIAAIYGAASEGFDRLNVALLINNIGLPSFGRFDPVVWFAVISAGGLPFSLVASEIVRRRIDTTSHFAVAGYLSAINGLLIVTVIGFALAGNFAIAVAAMWATQLLRRTNAPLKSVWVNQSLEPSVRATVFSMASQADSLGQILGGPLWGSSRR
jgi:DHA3 family tetracycline resistance protein-like MFS transporter